MWVCRVPQHERQLRVNVRPRDQDGGVVRCPARARVALRNPALPQSRRSTATPRDVKPTPWPPEPQAGSLGWLIDEDVAGGGPVVVRAHSHLWLHATFSSVAALAVDRKFPLNRLDPVSAPEAPLSRHAVIMPPGPAPRETQAES